MNERPLLARIGDAGTAAQAAIPGFYAWAVTVAPAAWARGMHPAAGGAAKLAALAGVALLVVSIPLETRRPRLARALSVWGLVATSGLVWALSPNALSAAHLDAARGVAGMIGWGLFAFSSAAPVLPRERDAARVVGGAPLRPRVPIPRGDSWFIVAGALFAVALQAVGWGVAVPERALLVRLVALASGLAVIGAATQIALARHARRVRPSRQTRVRRVRLSVLGLVLLAAAGVVLLLAGR